MTLDERTLRGERSLEQMLTVDLALQELSESAPRMARVVECRYFAGLSTIETAAALGVSHD